VLASWSTPWSTSLVYLQNRILDVTNTIPDDPIEQGPQDVADRVARQTLAGREAAYATEVRRLLDAALDVMRTCGTTSRPRVADIVAAAGLSNEAFYRHFPSKDALVVALLEDGARRLRSYLEHQMAKSDDPVDQVRRWIEGVLSQADDDIAATTLAVIWNGGSAGAGPASGRHFGSTPVGALLRAPFATLGSADPELDAALAAHATFGKLSDYLWQGTQPTAAEIDHIVDFCLAVVTPR
jgi:AcrR family transcriptional regulator